MSFFLTQTWVPTLTAGNGAIWPARSHPAPADTSTALNPNDPNVTLRGLSLAGREGAVSPYGHTSPRYANANPLGTILSVYLMTSFTQLKSWRYLFFFSLF